VKKRLSELRPGEAGVIVGFSGGEPILRRRLAEMGMTIGETVRVVRNAPLKDPVEFEVRGYNISLKRSEAEMVVVEVKENNSSISTSTRGGTSKNS
jgi:Fe2+ transport system protein FeoA